MGRKIRHKLPFYLVLAFLIALLIAFFYVVDVNAVSITTITPNFGKVYDRPAISGEVVPNVNWNVSFDINANGAFESNEQVASGTASSSTSINTYFVVPPCIGNDSGVSHAIQLASDYVYQGPNYLFVSAGPYDPPYVANDVFLVYTDRLFTVPSSVAAGVSIPIRLSITGGMPQTSYNYTVQVTKPDGSSSATSFTASTDIIGLASAALSYPGSFPSGQSTSQVGNYTVLVNELAPNSSIRHSVPVQVYASTPPYNPPNATITSIQPNPATAGTTVTFNGSGNASTGYNIIRYNWTSNISGAIGTSSNFTTSALPEGTHSITFTVQDSNNTWSQPAKTILQILPKTNPPPTNPPSNPPSENSSPPSNPPPSTPPTSNPPTNTSDSTTPTNTTSPPSSSSSNTTAPSNQSTPSSTDSNTFTSNQNTQNSQSSSNSTNPQQPSPNQPNQTTNTVNQPPIARLNSTAPTSITKGQSIILAGYGFDSDGTIVSYIWTSNLSGVVSTTSQLDTANLALGTHRLTFQVADNNNAVSEPLTLFLTVNPPFEALPYVAGATVGSVAAVSGAGAAVLLHYNRLSSFKIKTRLNQKNAHQEKKEQTQEEKEEKKQKKREERPMLKFEKTKIPQFIMEETPYFAKFTVKNVGGGKATNVLIQALKNPFVEYADAVEQIDNLKPGETGEASLSFTTNAGIRKDIYQLQFQLQCAHTQPKNKQCFMRGGRIAVLCGSEELKQTNPLGVWLRENHYPFQEIHDAAHLMTQLYQYDLLIVDYEKEMPLNGYNTSVPMLKMANLSYF